jgi:anti-anti-sigma regulatory factor
MAKLLLEGSGDSKKLRVAGRLTIQESSTLKDLLVEAYNAPGDLSLDLREAQGMDLACIQVLCSANITFRKSGRHISISGALPEEITKSLNDIAIAPKSCESESSAHCLWITGGRRDE